MDSEQTFLPDNEIQSTNLIFHPETSLINNTSSNNDSNIPDFTDTSDFSSSVRPQNSLSEVLLSTEHIRDTIFQNDSSMPTIDGEILSNSNVPLFPPSHLIVSADHDINCISPEYQTPLANDYSILQTNDNNYNNTLSDDNIISEEPVRVIAEVEENSSKHGSEGGTSFCEQEQLDPLHDDDDMFSSEKSREKNSQKLSNYYDHCNDEWKAVSSENVQKIDSSQCDNADSILVGSNIDISEKNQTAGEFEHQISYLDPSDENSITFSKKSAAFLSRSDFEVFASRTLAAIQNLQEQQVTDQEQMKEELNTSKVEIFEKNNKEIEKMTSNLESKLKTDYTNHLNAIREFYNSKIDEVVKREDNFVLSNVEKLEKWVSSEITKSESDAEERLEAVVEAFDHKLDFLKDKVELLQKNIEALSTAVKRACDLEQLPEPMAIPDGPKIRITVKLSVLVPSIQSLLIPISSNASVSNLKHEVIKRARRIGTIPDSVVYSTTVLSLEGLTLFEDDTFTDVGIVGGETLSLDFIGTSSLAVNYEPHTDPLQLNTSNINVTSLDQKKQELAQRYNSMESGNKICNVDDRKSGIDTSSNSSFKSISSTFSQQRMKNRPNPRSSLGPPPPNSSMIPPPPINLESSRDIICGYFLCERLAKEIAEREELDRRLMCELERMERDPLKQQYMVNKVRVARNALEHVRLQLLDMATYHRDPPSRGAARSMLATVDSIIENNLVSVDEINQATLNAQIILKQQSEDSASRIEALEEASARTQCRKETLKNEIQELAYELRNKVRIPYDLISETEKLLDDVDTSIILSQSMSVEQIEKIHSRITSFIDSIKKKTR